MVIKHRRLKHTETFAECLADEAVRFRQAAEEAPPGRARELLLRRVRMAEAAYTTISWNLRGLQRPRQ